MSASVPTVYVVDDDEAVQHSIAILLEEVDLQAKTFSSAQAFLDYYDPCYPGCLVLDIRMPGMSGLELQARLKKQGIMIPIIIISGYGDITIAIQAIKAGALDFIEKPFRDQVLLDNIQCAIDMDAKIRRQRTQQREYADKIARLTKRQRQLMEYLLTGKQTKTIATELGISQKTVDFHRLHILETMKCDSLLELCHQTYQYAPV